MNSLNDVLNMERSVQTMLAELKSQLYAAVEQSPMGCVKTIPGNVKAATVSFSDIAKHSFNLSPSYYIAECQAELVERKLSAANSATDFVNYIQSMIETKQVKINGHTERLNDKTVEVLQKYLTEQLNKE